MIAGNHVPNWNDIAAADGPVNRPLPPPTAAKPGTAAKIAILSVRAALGFELHHPLDVRHVPAPSTIEIPMLHLQSQLRPRTIED